MSVKQPPTITDSTSASEPSNASITAELNSDFMASARNLSQRVSNPKLSALRAQNPFLTIVPFPNSSVNVTLTASAAQNIDIPDQAKYFSIHSGLAAGGSAMVFCSRNGQAQVPGANADATNGAVSFAPGVFVYCEEIKQFSIVSAAAAQVAINFYQQL